MEPILEILQELHTLSQLDKPVGLITIYKNIPLLFNAKIIAFNEAAVDFQVHRYQWEASKRTRQVYIKSDQLSSIVLAKSVNVKAGSLIITLADFEYSEISIIRRSQVRVEPETTIPVILLINDSPIKAELADISTGGLSVFLKPQALETMGGETSVPIQGNIEILIKFPGEHAALLKLRCAIRDIREVPETGKYRMGLQITPDRTMGPFIARYIADRQKSILQELEAVTNISLRR